MEFPFIIYTVLFVISLRSVSVPAFLIDIQPHTVNGLIHNDAYISCQMEPSDRHVKEIMLLELSRNGTPIALIRHPSKLSLGAGMDAKYRADGNISNVVGVSQLRVTVMRPRIEDSGPYTCLLFYLDDAGVLTQTARTDTLTVSNQDMPSAITYLVDHLSDVQRQVSLLTDANKAQAMEIARLGRELTVQQERENKTVLFKARNNITTTNAIGQVYVYNDVISNEGQGYNAASGVFTAPFSGYYIFHLAATSNEGTFLYLELAISGRQGRLSNVVVGDRTYVASNDLGSLVKLEAGEKVMPVVAAGTSSNHQQSRLDPNHEGNQFSGYLLKAL